MAQFVVGDYEYLSDRMDCLTQERVARRLAPVLPALMGDDGTGERKAASIVEAVCRALDAIDDDKATFIYAACLSRCRRRTVGSTTGGWGPPCWNLAANVPVMGDMSFVAMVTIAAEVIKAELGNFSAELPWLSQIGSAGGSDTSQSG